MLVALCSKGRGWGAGPELSLGPRSSRSLLDLREFRQAIDYGLIEPFNSALSAREFALEFCEGALGDLLKSPVRAEGRADGLLRLTMGSFRRLDVKNDGSPTLRRYFFGMLGILQSSLKRTTGWVRRPAHDLPLWRSSHSKTSPTLYPTRRGPIRINLGPKPSVVQRARVCSLTGRAAASWRRVRMVSRFLGSARCSIAKLP